MLAVLLKADCNSVEVRKAGTFPAMRTRLVAERQPKFFQGRPGDIFSPQLAVPTCIEQVGGDLKCRLRWINSIGLVPTLPAL